MQFRVSILSVINLKWYAQIDSIDRVSVKFTDFSDSSRSSAALPGKGDVAVGTSMTRLLASHIAGFRLLRIVLLLSIPAVLLGWQLFSQVQDERVALKANSDSLTLLAMTVPVMIDVVDGQEMASRKQVLLEFGPKLAKAVGVGVEFEAMRHDLEAAPHDARGILQKASLLAAAVGTGSARQNGGDREANALINLASTLLPRLLESYNTLRSQEADCMADSAEGCARMQDLVLASAGLEFKARELGMGTVAARALSDDIGPYNRLLNSTYWLTFDAAALRTSVLQSGTPEVTAVANMDQGLTAGRAKWSSYLQAVWTDINDRLGNNLLQRKARLEGWLMRTIAISVAAVALGIVTALSLFRSSFRKLDELEEARALANNARSEAERTNDDLAELNNGMVSINAELAENLKALKSAQDQLVKKTRMEQMGQLTATIAHELRNPLGAVRTSTFLLERKTRGRDLGIEGQIQRINNGITRCDDIITQLLDFSRTKQVVTSAEDFDLWLERTVGEEAQRLSPQVTINCEFGLGGLNVPFDPTRMQRAIGNLLSNAAEALMGQDMAAVPPPVISVSTRHEGEFVFVEVRDNGPGIKSENLSRIREPLFTTKSFGTGLGLPAVEQIVVQHGGTLHVSSELGKGACFTLQLPLHVVIESAA
jgi:signal transduction histidine kinase